METEKRREDMTQQEKVAAAHRQAQIDAGALNEAPAEPLAAERGRFTTEDPAQAKKDAQEHDERQARASRGQLTTKGEKIPPMAIDRAAEKAKAAAKAPEPVAKANPLAPPAKPAVAPPLKPFHQPT